MDYLGYGECKPMRLLPQLFANQQHPPRPARFNSSGVNFFDDFQSTNDINDGSQT